MGAGIFVTGTDTGVGKTVVCQGLIHALVMRGHRVIGMKPVASGATRTPAGLRNEDVLDLQDVANVPTAYDAVNPYCFERPVAPHLAALEEGTEINLDVIHRQVEIHRQQSDWLVVEGVGGWQMPLNPSQTVADLAARLQLPVLLVVGIRLGCLNHALLTARDLERSGVHWIAWVANLMDETMSHCEENIAALGHLLAPPLLGIVPNFESPIPASVAASLDLDIIETRSL